MAPFKSKLKSSPFKQFIKHYMSKYNHCLEKYPFLTQGLSASFLFGSGDYICQKLEQRGASNSTSTSNTNTNNNGSSSSIDYQRITRMILYGSFVFAPCAHIWYKFLDRKIIITKNNKFKQITKKVLLDEFVFTPVILGAFFSTLTSLEYLNEKFKSTPSSLSNSKEGTENINLVHLIIDKLKRDYLHTFFVDMIVWPPLQYFNFFLVPSAYRVLYINFCCLFWNAFLSMQQHKH